jgi:negative regulator of flagellin synthesis FlgM
MADAIRGVNPIDVLGVSSADQSGSPPLTAPKVQSGAAAAVDSADLSRSQALLTTIAQASAGVSSIDRARVAELQQALNSGTYQANPALIAEKVMEIESLLSSSAGSG